MDSINHKKDSLKQTEIKRVSNEMVKVSSLHTKFRQDYKQSCARNSRRSRDMQLEASEQYGSPRWTYV